MKTSTQVGSRKSIFVSILALTSALVGCRGQNENSAELFTTDTQADALESGITMLQGMADDASGSSFAYQSVRQQASPFSKLMIAQKLFLETAQAANCGRAYSQACNVGIKSASYTGCQIGSSFSLSGEVTLTYSNNACNLDVGDNVVRTYDHTISGPRGGSIQTTSALRVDYRGTQIGGGGRLTRIDVGRWQAEILGKHKIGTRSGRNLFDVSVCTTTPVEIEGTLARSGRTVSSGVLEVHHNSAGFTAVFSVVNGQPLVWNSSCAHPISGQLSATYSGRVSGSGTITFNGCGTALLSKDGSTRTLTIGYAE